MGDAPEKKKDWFVRYLRRDEDSAYLVSKSACGQQFILEVPLKPLPSAQPPAAPLAKTG